MSLGGEAEGRVPRSHVHRTSFWDVRITLFLTFDERPNGRYRVNEVHSGVVVNFVSLHITWKS